MQSQRIPKSFQLVDARLLIQDSTAYDAGQLGFIARMLAQSGLPYRDPGEGVHVYERKNGRYSLRLVSHAGIPYGGKFGIRVKSGHKAISVLGLNSVRKGLPLRTVRAAAYLIENTRSFKSPRRSHFRTLHQKRCTRDRSYRCASGVTVGYTAVYSSSLFCNHFLHVSRTYPYISLGRHLRHIVGTDPAFVCGLRH